MSGTLVVLVVVLVAQLSVKILALAATFFLARRNGHRLKSMSSWSLRGLHRRVPRRQGTAERKQLREQAAAPRKRVNRAQGGCLRVEALEQATGRTPKVR